MSPLIVLVMSVCTGITPGESRNGTRPQPLPPRAMRDACVAGNQGDRIKDDVYTCTEASIFAPQ